MKNILMTVVYFLIGLALSFFVFYGLGSPYIPMIMLLPVFIATSLFGVRYGGVTAFAAAAAIYFFFCEPLNYFVYKDNNAYIRVATFLLLAGASIAFIAKRRAVDDAILESEKHFRQLSDNAPVLVWMAGTDKLCYYFNNAWLDFTGRTMEQEMGNGWAEGVHPDDLQRCMDIYTRSFDGKEYFSMEYRLRCYDGSYRWILDNGTPRFDEDGKFFGYIGSCTDITDIKEFAERIKMERESKQRVEELLSIAVDAEEEAQALNEELEATNEELEASFATIEAERNKIQAIVDELPNIIIIKDKNLRYTFINKALCGFLKKTEAEILGKTVFDFLSVAEAEQIWENEKAILQNNESQTVEETVVDADGKAKTLMSVKRPIITEEGEIGLFVVITDITDRKTMETALKNSEARYKAISDRAVVGFYVVQDGKMSYVNEAYAKMLGYDSAEEIIGKINVIDLVAPRDRELADGLLEKRFNGEIKEARYDAALLRKDGREIVVEAHGAIGIYDDKPAVMGVLIDRTLEKNLQNELKESEEKFRTMFENSYDAILLSDEHGFIDCNQRALELFGIHDKAELVNYHPSDLSPASQPNGEDSFAEAVKQIQIATEKGSSHFEWLSMRRNKEIFPSDVLLSSFGYRGKTIIQATVRDISDKYEARRISALLQKFFDNTSEGMTIADPLGHIIAVNPAFTAITGYLPEEVVGKNPRILQSGEHSRRFYEKMWQDVLEKGRWEGEIRNKRKSGETYPEWLTITPIRNESGSIEHFVAVFLDLTQIKDTQHRLDEQERMIFAQSRFAAMGEMIGMIAHQWRQPITAIGMGANNMIMDIELGDMDAQIFKKHLEQISTQVQFLSGTIDDFRNFFKPNREMAEVQIDKIVDGALKIIAKSLENNNIEVRKEIEYNPLIRAYESELIQMLLAIIGNAKDAMMEHSVKSAAVTIATLKNPSFPDFVELHICDNGGGVPAEIAEKIFEPYFTTKSAKNGTGLGLYIAKTIIEKHQGGSMGVKNQGDGACFWIRLPIKDNDAETSA